MLLHLLRPTAGRAWVMGVPAGDVELARRHVGYVPGEVALWPQLTGLETLTVLGNLSDRVDVAFRDALIDRFRRVSGRRRGGSQIPAVGRFAGGRDGSCRPRTRSRSLWLLSPAHAERRIRCRRMPARAST